MDPSDPTRPAASLAPGAPGGALRAPSPDSPPAARLPAIDDNVLAEDSEVELLDGRALALAPAEEGHATQHFDLPAVLGHCLAPGYRGAADLLTRPDRTSNFAPDVSVYPAARDPATGGRQVEELCFEVRDTTSVAELTAKAGKLVARGVRRVFRVDVADRVVYEWSPARAGWDALAADAVLTDRCLATPVPVRALADALAARATVARALLAQGEPVLQQALTEAEGRGEARGRAEGEAVGTLTAKRDVLRKLLTRGGAALTAAQRTRLDACADGAQLDAWLDRALAGADAGAILG